MAGSLIVDNYRQVLDRITQTCQTAVRAPNEVKLIVVTKGHPVGAVREVVGAGACFLGENYVEEAVDKITACSDLPGLEWHMIGHIQSRKAQEVSNHFDWVQAVDSFKLARRLDGFNTTATHTPILLECNVSGEESKFGFPAWDETSWRALLPEFSQILDLSHLRVHGLMTMPPFLDDPEDVRPYFKRLRKFQEFLTSELPGANWSELSMGMSADYQVAVQEGATIVRIGTAIMGPRPGAAPFGA